MRLAEGHIPWPRRAPCGGQATKPPARFEVTCDGDGIAGHAGSALLGELADRLGLTTALGWRAGRTQTSRHRHRAGAVLRDLVVLLADGGDCLSDLAVLRQQPELFGPVASTPTAWRVIEQVACDLDGLAGLRAARAHARAAAWRAGAHPDGVRWIDVDGTLLDAHSPKQGAAGTYKGGFGCYPLLAYLDPGDGTGEALAGLLRPGNPGSNTAHDHIDVVDLALVQLPSATGDQPIVVRADTGGATHALVHYLRQRGVRFSVSLPADERVRDAVLAADGVPNRQIAPMVGMHEHTVAHWRRRFQAERLVGLQDRKRPGRPLVYGHDQRLRIVATVTRQPPDPASHWSHSQLAKELADMGISASQIGRILADLDIKPHRVRSWITRPDDPGFWERAADICGLYLVPPTNALVLSVDEKTGMPTRSRTLPTTRLASGRSIRQEHEYVRHGTAILLAALDVRGGGIFSVTDLDRNTAANFIDFLDELDVKVPAGLQVHLVLDNGSSHIARDTRWWFVDHPRFHPHYTQAMPGG
jgi:transposase